MCEILDIPRSSHYQSLQIVLSNRKTKYSRRKFISFTRKAMERYGAPNIHESLLSKGFSLSLKRVQRLMSKARIRSITKKKYRPYPSKEKVI
ncbi:transposase [Peribacillus sp. TH14]|nr:transposase [Peribacillus sp. TH14]